MDYSKLAEGIFSALGAEEDVEADVESEITADAGANTESSSVKESVLGSNLQKTMAAISASGIVIGTLGAIYNRFKGASESSTLIYAFLGIGGVVGLLLTGMAIPNFKAERNIKKAEALVRATERYIRRQAEQQALEAEAEAEAERAAEQTKAAQTFFTDTKTGMGLGIDFSNPMNLSSAMGNIGDFNASSGRNSGVVLRANPSAEKFKWL